MISVDPNDRPTIDEILLHPWINCQENFASPSEVYFEMKDRETYIVSSVSGAKPNAFIDDETFELLFQEYNS